MAVFERVAKQGDLSPISDGLGALSPTAVRVFFNPDRLPSGQDEVPRGLFRLTMPSDLETQKPVRRLERARKVELTDEAGLAKQPYLRTTFMTGFNFRPQEVNIFSQEEYELLSKHPDFKEMVQIGVFRVMNPRTVTDANANPVPSTTGTTADYEKNDAIEIVRKSVDITYLSQSIQPERNLGREDVVREIQQQMKKIQDEVMSRQKVPLLDGTSLGAA